MTGRSQGYTLIELMIVVAIIGISVVVLGDGLVQQREQGADLLSAERALQVLEYEADCIARRRPAEPSTRAALLADLPKAELSREQSASDRVTLRVGWRASNGQRQSRELTIFGRAP